MNVRAIKTAPRSLDHDLQLSGSKSLANRALITAGLARGRSVLKNLPASADILQLMSGLGTLGVRLEHDAARGEVRIDGCDGRLPVAAAAIDCGESGSMLRFLTAVCAAGHGRFRLHGRGRLHERPMQPLIDALRALGSEVVCEQRAGWAPLTVQAGGLRGGGVNVDGTLSSQFISALLLAAPCAAAPVEIHATGEVVSRPYVDLTLDVMRQFGVQIVEQSSTTLVVSAPQGYRARELPIEADASSAGYFLAAAALCGGRLRITGLGAGSRQADVGLLALLEELGCEVRATSDTLEVRQTRDSGPLPPFDMDFGDMPDAVPTAAVLALFASGACRLRRIGHLRFKESDRIAALAAELQRLGAGVVVESQQLTVQPPPRVTPATVKTYGDHRIAMAFGIAGLAVQGLQIEEPECVAKSFPDFFAELDALAAEPG